MQDSPSDTSVAPIRHPSRLDRPRLADLFLLTFCLAVFLAACRYAYDSDYNFVLWRLNDVELFGYGVGVACCWTGIFRLLIHEGRLGFPPPNQWQPGEVICVVEGVYYLTVAILGGWFRYSLLDGAPTLAEEVEQEPLESHIVAMIYVAPPLIFCWGYAWLARKVTVPAWRWGAIAKLISLAATPILLWMVVYLGFIDADTSVVGMMLSIVLLGCVLIPTGMILAAAWGDRQRKGIHWLHWLGVFAFTAIQLSRFSLETRAFLSFFGE